VPRILIDLLETVNAGRNIVNSFPVDFNFRVLIKPDKTHVAVPTENSHQREVAGAFKTLLEILIDTRRVSGFRPIARMTVEVGQKLVDELFEL
jgi:hypothetical protein